MLRNEKNPEWKKIRNNSNSHFLNLKLNLHEDENGLSGDSGFFFPKVELYNPKIRSKIIPDFFRFVAW